LKDRYLVIVGAGQLSVPAYEKAKEMGLKTIAVDQNENAPGMALADEHVIESTRNRFKIYGLLKKMNKKLNIVGITSCGANVSETTIGLAHSLSLPGPKLSFGEVGFNLLCNTENKWYFHCHLDRTEHWKHPSIFSDKPFYRTVWNEDEAIEACKKNNIIPFSSCHWRRSRPDGFPYIFKPPDSCGGRGVSRVDSLDDVSQAYHLAWKHVQSSNHKRRYCKSAIEDRLILIEECLEGTKHTVEMIAVGKYEYHLMSIIDTYYLDQNTPCESLLTTTTLSERMQQKAFLFAVNIAQRLGLHWGPFKADINISPDGKIRVIEAACRLSGGWHCQFATPVATGIDNIGLVIRQAIGEKIPYDDFLPRRNKGAAILSIFPEPGIVKSIKLPDSLPRGIDRIILNCKVGDEVGPYINSADRVGWILAGAETTKIAVSNAKNALKKIKIRTKKKEAK